MIVGQFSGIVLLYSCKNLRSGKKLQLKRTFPYYLFITAPFLLCCKESPIWASLPDCADCRLNGGQPQKPGFWQ